ncbi:short-chain dehydrogenase, putative [Talaromyces stipitatus ATCC 10500]|uniref:Short-chain dehydrogenase, putative n=1 Tax=Talaromyces stipitatus (strain ATCC 10500 / CBS 375.48 / QM 6759 / NRRL 1006) TaxID=441959 RepID=B8LYZ2_TALSN|nr:short-chain dehydrogenase, putative [Talaromyces stipitatus ATCC 10500]EED23500.1 short-chain dehydrogenase, putative [Talaromyces stipitatus ATCC 10500]
MESTTAKGTIIVTGANGGLGSAITKEIVSKPEFSAYYGLYLVRDAAYAPALDSVLATSSKHPHEALSIDLTDLDSVRKAAEAINLRVSEGKIPQIRALVLNAGFQDFGKQTWTKDGFDTTFSVNYLGHWLLTLLLLKSIDRDAGRIVIVGSQAHDPNDKRNDSSKAFIDDKYNPMIRDKDNFEAIAKGKWSSAIEDTTWRSGFRRYGAAKLCLTMMMHELQHRMNTDPQLKSVCILGVDPGAMSTGLQRHASWFIRVLLFQIVLPLTLLLMSKPPLRPTQKSASHILQAAFDSNEVLGQYPKDLYFNGDEPLETSEESRDAQKRELVWKESVRYTQLKEGETVLAAWE